LEVKFKINLDELQNQSQDINMKLTGEQLVTFNIEDDEIIEEYQSQNDNKQSQMLMNLLGDYIGKYSDFVESIFGKGIIDRDIIEDSISTAVKEDTNAKDW